MNNSELLDFTGGVNTVVAPHLLPLNEAIFLANVDIKFGALKSITNLENTSAAQGKFFVEYRRKLYYYDNWRSNALIDDKLYWSNGVYTGKILPDGTELPLGIITPTTKLVQTTSGNIGDGVHSGEYKYTYTFYSSDTGVESAPAPLPGYVRPDEQDVELSGFEALPSNADSYRIYRIGGYLTRFTLVDTMAYGTSTYIDSIDDTMIDGRFLQTLRTGTPPVGIQNFVELNGRLFGTVRNKVYFSGLGAPDSWYTDDWFNLPDNIIALAKVPAGLLVMGRTYTYLLFGGAPSNFRLKVVSAYLGCVSNRSVSYYNEKVLFLGLDGIYMSDGYSVQNLTYRKIEIISNLSVNSSAVANDVYYIAFKPARVPTTELYPSNELFPGSTRGAGGGTDSAEGLIALDFKRGQYYSYHFLEYRTAISIGIYQSELYLVLDGTREPILCNRLFNCSNPFCYGEQVMAKLGGTINDTYKTLRYLSPQLIDGSYSTLKEYDKVRVNFVGAFTITVIFANNDIAVVERINSPVIVTNDLTLQTEQDSVAIIGIPNKANKSYSIQFLVEGTGVVKSIQYSWKNREQP